MFGFFRRNKPVFEITDNKGITWYLHSQQVELKHGNGTYTTYFFAKNKRSNICEMPVGYMIITNKRTGMPLLKKNPKITIEI